MFIKNEFFCFIFMNILKCSVTFRVNNYGTEQDAYVFN